MRVGADEGVEVVVLSSFIFFAEEVEMNFDVVNRPSIRGILILLSFSLFRPFLTVSSTTSPAGGSTAVLDAAEVAEGKASPRARRAQRTKSATRRGQSRMILFFL